MLRIDLHITNPWHTNNFKNIYCKSGLFLKNKAYEFEIIKHNYDFLTIHLSTEVSGSDHAGPRIELAVLGYSVSFKIYDTRHWNYDKNDWEIYSE